MATRIQGAAPGGTRKSVASGVVPSRRVDPPGVVPLRITPGLLSSITKRAPRIATFGSRSLPGGPLRPTAQAAWPWAFFVDAGRNAYPRVWVGEHSAAPRVVHDGSGRSRRAAE